MFEFKFPDVGEGIAEGEIVRWLVAVGDRVKAHQPIVEMETDKAVVELPAPVGGTVRELRGAEGDTIQVGEVLAVIEEEAAAQPERPAALGVVGQLEVAEEPPPAEAEPEAPVAVLPADRKLAEELGVDLVGVKPSGPRGRITAEDIRAAAGAGEARTEAPREPERIPLKGVRKVMARSMVASHSSAVHVTIMERADALALRELRQRERKLVESRGLKLTYLPLVVKALTLVLERYPLLNSSLDEQAGQVVLHREINIGFAVDTPDGLLVPVVRRARHMSILELAGALLDLSERARQRKITPAELKGGTFTVTNYGAIGGLWGTPIINPPEAAILGIGRIEEAPVVREGQVVARPVVPLSLTFDHRIIDGATAQRFFNALIEHIENPDLILLEN
ncbi:dihydrolipoamide acetyltransferase component of pyruvate dehydrogenase complex [Desulfuromonas versatilis]|uniref:Dihydrolipoamide acetyltransferase component of pyruvate dehydrogenase complex n=1 Tax=Desulfuromonas versatilis TaxID=2802975 RepID=A0ABM8HVU9_9BACT|nr:dihydrolipoamide acetyltransferase family protein [Desulfuromonas versatilis]BCR06073.1 dihydrolipoamide acetyltransferase component of pyruvate dehydrogenase complex [Desulfuromonas versatilis]